MSAFMYEEDEMDVPSFMATQIPLWASAVPTAGGEGEPPLWFLIALGVVLAGFVGFIGWLFWDAWRNR